MSPLTRVLVFTACCSVCLLASDAQAFLNFNVTQDTTLLPGFTVNTITVDTDSDLIDARAVVNLDSGSLFKITIFDGLLVTPTQSLGPGDSFVSINDDPTTGLGGFLGTVFHGSEINIRWSNTAQTDIGAGLHIATFTFSNDATGTIELFATNAGDAGFADSGFTLIQNGVVIPEPGALGLMVLGSAALLRRR